MKDRNRVELIGTLTDVPELRKTTSGSSVLSFTVKTSYEYQKDGETRSLDEYHRCAAFGKIAEQISQRAQQGRTMFVEGRLQTRSWETQTGEKKYRTEIIVYDANFFIDSILEQQRQEFPTT